STRDGQSHCQHRIACIDSQPTRWDWLESRERADRPTLGRGLAHLFKLRKTQRVEHRIDSLGRQGNRAAWGRAGQGWTAGLNSGAAGDRVAPQARWPAPNGARFGATLAA
ncbi:MAG: hypothetical protein ACK6DZ_25825, partial [Acidobacteriota bacterium]